MDRLARPKDEDRIGASRCGASYKGKRRVKQGRFSRYIGWLWLIGGGLILAGCSRGGPTSPLLRTDNGQPSSPSDLAATPSPHSLTEFGRFSYEQAPGDGFCPDEGFLRVDVSRRPSGDYYFSATQLEIGEDQSSQCLTGYASDQCLIAAEVPARPLSEDEQQALLSLLGAIEFEPAPADCPIEEYCNLEEYGWDERAFPTAACRGGHVTEQDDEELQALFQSFAATTLSLDGALEPFPEACSQVDGLQAAIWDVEVTPDGLVWVASNRSVANYDANAEIWTVFSGDEAPPGNGARTVTTTEDGVWITTWGRVGASYYDGETWRTLTTADGLPDDEVNDVAVDGRGDVWFATNGGVARLAAQTGEWWYPAEEFETLGQRFYRIAESPSGAIWFGNSNDAAGLTPAGESGKGQIEPPGSRGAPGQDRIDYQAMLWSPDGRLWATAGDRPVFLEDGRWNASESCDYEVRSMAAAENGDLWVGTDYGGVYLCPKDGRQQSESGPLFFDKFSGLGSDEVMSVAAQGKTLWVGTSAGLAYCALD
jgi:hypothetical protein